MRGLKYHIHASLRSLSLLVMLLATITAMAQTKKGTTVILDKASTTTFSSYVSSASEDAGGKFGFMRHNVGPVQVLSSSSAHANLSSTGAGLFVQNDNLMSFTSDGKLVVNPDGNSTITCLVFVVPKGYSFIGYEGDIDAANSTSGATIGRYTYRIGRGLNSGRSFSSINSIDNYTVGSANTYVGTIALNSSANVIYFQVNGKITFNSFKVTYAANSSFAASLPGADDNFNVHTGALDPGIASGSTTFKSDNVINDYESMNFYEGSEKIDFLPKALLNNVTYIKADNGDYYAEAPKGFRIVGGSLKLYSLKQNTETKQLPAYSTSDVSFPLPSISDNTVYVYIITDKNGNYMNVDANGNITTGTDPSTATQWIFEDIQSDGQYWLIYANTGTEQSPSYHFLTYSIGNAISVTTRTDYASGQSILNEVIWQQDNNGFYSYNLGTGYIGRSSSGWILVRANSSNPKAGLQDLIKNEQTTITQPQYVTSNSVTIGDSYIFTDGNGNYLNCNTSTGRLSNVTSVSDATEWRVGTVGQTDGGFYIYSFECGDKSNPWFLQYTGRGRTLALSTGRANASTGNLTTEQVWLYGKVINNNTTTDQLWNYYNYQQGNQYQIAYSAENGGWIIAGSGSTSLTAKWQEPQYIFGNTCSVSIYNRNNSGSVVSGTADGSETAKSLNFTGFNNDAIHFNISGVGDRSKAAVQIELQLEPLNPELQDVTVKNSTEASGTQYDASNFELNNGEAINYPLAQGSTANVTFSDAKSEEGTSLYGTSGNSNYFLVGGEGDNGGTTYAALNSTSTATQREATDKAGTSVAGYTTETLSKSNVGLNTVSLNSGDDKTVYIYVADQPTYNILPSSIGSKHISYRSYKVRLVATAPSVASATITPIYKQTLKSPNHKNSSYGTDNSLDESVTFVGVKVQTTDVSGNVTSGVLTSKQIVDAIDKAINDDADIAKKDGDVRRGVLYIDMSGLSSVSDNDEFTKDFDNSTADNCLYFMPADFAPADNTLTNVIDKSGDNFVAVTDIDLKDQQPFFSPYDFTTGNDHKVTYVRESSSKTTPATVKNMAVVLPFDVELNGDGTMKSGNDDGNTVTYYNINNQGDVKEKVRGAGSTTYYVYGVDIAKVTTGTAKANQPYYVTTTSNGFTYDVTNAKFSKTTVSDDFAESLNNTEGGWNGVGTYAGVTPAYTTKGMWYLQNEYFWNANLLTKNKVVKFRPFRAYFINPSENSKVARAEVFFDDDNTSTGIDGVAREAGDLSIDSGTGVITVKAGAPTSLRIYSIAGQTIANGKLASGETESVNVPKGVYVVNGIKVVVK